MGTVYQVVMTLKESQRVIHIGMFTTYQAADNCMMHAEARPYPHEAYSKEIWQHTLSDEWDGMIDYAEDLACYLK